MTFIQLSKDFCRTMVISIAKLVVCFCFYTSFCFKCCLSYQVTPRNSKYNSDRTLNQFSSDVKYPNFYKVMARIDNMNDEVKTKSNLHKLRHKGWNQYYTTSTTTTTTAPTTETDLFETYGDMDEDDYFDSYEDQEDQDDDFDYGDDDEFSDNDEDSYDTFGDFQAEEPTEAPAIRGNSISRPISRISEMKWQLYGTREKVEESRNQQLNKRPSSEESKVKAVLEHYKRVNGQSKCLIPSLKVIPVQQEHPNPSKTYTPHCTVLHRCAEDTGCCRRDTKCQFKTRQVVHLYVYASLLGSSEIKVEKLPFYNHTECECKQRTDSTSAESTKDIGYKSANAYYGNTSPMNEERCKCPKRFSKVITHKCTCDCEEDNEDCLQLKKGKEHFSMTDRICIQDGDCTIPTCEYGLYAVTDGKCPSKKEKLNDYKLVKIND